MAWRAQFGSEIWVDPTWRILTAEEKLARLWLETNSTRSNIGLTKATPEKFQFDTGLPPVVLSRLLAKLSKLYPKKDVTPTMSEGGEAVSDGSQTGLETLLILSLEFVNQQWRGMQKNWSSSMGKALCREAAALPDDLRQLFMDRYPSLADGVKQCPTVGGVSPDPQFSSVQSFSSSKKGSGEDAVDFTDEEILAFGREFKGEPATGAPGPMDEDWLLAWLAQIRRRSGDPPKDWRKALVADWRVEHRRRSRGDAGGKKRERWQVQKELDAVRAEIQKLDSATGDRYENLRRKRDALAAELDAL
jgi:hypothetical protein